MFKPELGVSLHTISKCIDDNLIEHVANSKIKTLELSQRIFLENTEMVKSCIRKLSTSKIKIASIHSDYHGVDISSIDRETRGNAIRSAFNSIVLAEEFGAQIIVQHSSFEPIGTVERVIRGKYAKESIIEIAEKCSQAGKRLAIELLPRTCLGNTADGLFELTDGLPENIVGFCLDTNHLMNKPFLLADIVNTFGKCA